MEIPIDSNMHPLFIHNKDHPEEHITALATTSNVHFAGMTTSNGCYDRFIASIHHANVHAWVIDSGTTDHICTSLELMHYVVVLPKPIILSLPNGNQTTVQRFSSFSTQFQLAWSPSCSHFQTQSPVYSQTSCSNTLCCQFH